jgi:hypothetical protein
MMQGAPTSFFISYSRRNSCFVDRLECDLAAQNFLTWVDRRPIESTQPWKDVLRDAIDLSHSVLLVLSSPALLSPQVRMEYCYALRMGKPLIVIEHQTCAELPPELQNIQHISFTTDMKQGWQNLRATLSEREAIMPAQVMPLSRTEYLHKEARSAEAAKDWRKATGRWLALLEIDGQNNEVRHSLEHCLRMQGMIAGEEGQWELAMSYWEVLLRLKPDDVQATRQFALVQHNQEYMEHYRDVEQLIQDDMLPLAKITLKQLYEMAPYYGDPLKLMQKVSMQELIRTPMTFEREIIAEAKRVKEQAIADAEVARQQAIARAEVARQQAIARAEEARQQAIADAKWAEQQAIARAEDARQQAIADAEKAERLVIEQVKRSTPGWFILHEMETEPFAVWCSCFLLVSGLGSVIGIITQSWNWAIIAMIVTIIVAYMLGYHRIVQHLPARLQQPINPAKLPAKGKNSDESDLTLIYAITAFFIVALGAFATFCMMFFLVLPLQYDLQHTDHFLWISRTSWLGGQIKLGAIAGGVLSFIFTIIFQSKHSFGIALLKSLTYGSPGTFLFWIIISSCGLVFNLGWGFASAWTISLIGLGAGFASGVGLGSSFVVWAKGKVIF